MKIDYHRLLKRQLKKYLFEEDANAHVPENFLDAVNDAYFTFETDFKQLDRMLEISSDELFKVNQNLGKVNEELDRFVYSASHDLKAPLSSLAGLVELAKIDIQNPENTLQYLAMMHSSIQRLMKVINDLADFSRNERLALKLKPIDFDLLVREIIESLKFIPNVDKVDFKIAIQNNGNNIFESDLLRLRILLNNLIANALLYHNFNQKTPIIIIEIIYDDKKANLSIMDNGKGIEEEHHKRVFDMFYRASQDSRGSGLGLYIVKGIVDKLQGELSLDSDYGHGTCFNITIPNMRYRQVKQI